MDMSEWRKEHRAVICDFLQQLNKQTDEYILKGGTSLMLFYNLDRFSEDIDLDSINPHKIKSFVKEFCEKNGYSYRVAKDTETVQRYMINYQEDSFSLKPLKVEISFRKDKFPPPTEQVVINDTVVYSVNAICKMKAEAYKNRDKIRDLYDLGFICEKYWNTLSNETKDAVVHSVKAKGIEQFDYVTKNQKDELIDYDKMLTNFLDMCCKIDEYEAGKQVPPKEKKGKFNYGDD